ncbi:MAG: hypothetical protein HY608_03695 [Planctomycetes bacterium]|nr:hypothetical protein [Planctomycetota bacterium]
MFLATGLLVSGALARADEPAGESASRGLYVRQLQVQRRLERLEEGMRALMERYAALPEEDPKRHLLGEALERMGNDLVVAKADAARQSLTEGDLERARAQAADLASSLRSILAVLSADTRGTDVEARREETRQTRDEVERIAQEEERLRQEAEAIRSASVPQAVRAASDALREARREQEALAARTARSLGTENAERSAAAAALQRLLEQHLALQARGEAGEPGGTPTGEERRLAEQVDAASRAMAQVGSQTPPQDAGAWQDAAREAAASAESMRDAAQSRAEGNPQEAHSSGEQAAQALREAIESLQAGALPPPGAADPEGAREQEALAEKVEQAARSLEESMDEMTPEQQEAARAASQSASQAAEQMRRAAEAMRSEDLSRAPGLQQQAVEYLKQAEEGMQLLERKFLNEEDRRKLERLVAQQREIEQRTRAVARKLQIEQELAERDAGRSAHQAAEQMNVVQGEFRKENLDSGIWEAERAIEYLREAAQALRRQENRYATEQAEIKLSKLQSELTKLQIDQEALRDETRTELAPGAGGTWEDASRDDLAARQGGLAGACDALEAELAEVGSDAYAWSLHDVGSSMRSAQSAIREGHLDPGAVGHQEAALRMLSIMLDGLKELLGRLEDEDRRGQAPRQMAQTGDMKMPLVRALDELRLILAIEREVQSAIQAAEARAASGQDVSAPEMERLRARRASSRDLAEKWEAKFRDEVR